MRSCPAPPGGSAGPERSSHSKSLPTGRRGGVGVRGGVPRPPSSGGGTSPRAPTASSGSVEPGRPLVPGDDGSLSSLRSSSLPEEEEEEEEEEEDEEDDEKKEEEEAQEEERKTVARVENRRKDLLFRR